MSHPRPVQAQPWTWHHDDGTDELCVAIQGAKGRQIIIPAKQLREIADALHDRADAIDYAAGITHPHRSKEPSMTNLNDASREELLAKITELTKAKESAEAGQDTYRRLLVDYYGFNVDSPPVRVEASPLLQATQSIGSTVTATFPGSPYENADGDPVGVSETTYTTATVIGMVVTQGEVERYGIDPTTAGLTIVDGTGTVVRRNPLEEN